MSFMDDCKDAVLRKALHCLVKGEKYVAFLNWPFDCAEMRKSFSHRSRKKQL